jgi:uncharacterized delta-60 repeat protein
MARQGIVQPDGKIVVAAAVANSRGDRSPAVLRYNPDGTLDSTFGSGGIALITLVKGITTGGSGFTAVALQSDGKIVLAGSQVLSPTPINNQYDWEWILARYNANGTLDTTFGGGRHPTGIAQYNLTTGADNVSAMQLQPWDGKIVVAGKTQGPSGDDIGVARFNTNGTLDTAFGNGGLVTYTTPGAHSDSASSLVLQADHKIVVAGSSTGNGNNELLLLRYNSDGSLDTSFNGTGVVATGPLNAGNAVVQQSDGSIVVAGSVPGQAALERFTITGALDSSFGSNGTALISGLSVLNGLVIHPNTGGEFDIAGIWVPGPNDYSGAVGRVQTNGNLDPKFGANAGLGSYFAAHSAVLDFGSLALQSDGNLIITADMPSGNALRNIVVMRLFGATNPTIGAFAASPNPVNAGSNVTLTISNITDPNPINNITQVAIYLDSDGNGTPDSADALIGYATQTSPGVWTLIYTVNLAPGTYTLFAQAEDTYGLFSFPFALSLTVQ